MSYTLLPEHGFDLHSGGVIRDEDGAWIPADPENRDWQDYLAWVEAGGTAAPATFVPPETG